MVNPVPESLRSNANARVLVWLADKSAHDEVATALIEATKPLGDVRTYCPDPSQFRYLAVATRGVIFGAATGMSTISLRLDPVFRDRALHSGAETSPETGPDWVSFTLFRNDWPEPDLKFWALNAYVIARGNT